MKSKKLFTKVLSIALVCVMLVVSMGAYSGEDEKSVQEKSYSNNVKNLDAISINILESNQIEIDFLNCGKKMQLYQPIYKYQDKYGIYYILDVYYGYNEEELEKGIENIYKINCFAYVVRNEGMAEIVFSYYDEDLKKRCNVQ